MNNYMEITGKTVDDAFTNALIQLETTSDNVDYEVIDKGSSGILGFGSRPAKIKAWRKSDVVKSDADKEKEENATVKKEEPVAVPVTAQNADTSDKSDKKPKKAIASCDIDKVIRDFLTNMFNAMNMDVKIDISIDENEGSVDVELSGDDMGLLIGKRGQTLDSIQYLVSLVVNKENEHYLRVKVDTEDYRRRRKETLESLAKNIAYKVKRSKRSVSLEPMNPYERRIIHSALQNDKYVATRSEGEEPFRHVIVYLKNDYRSSARDGYKKDYNRN